MLWTPSHAKQPDWQPEHPHDASFLREMNAAADCAANACMRRRLQGAARLSWASLQTRNAAWEFAAIHRVAEVSRQYHEHLKTLGLRPRE